MLGRFFASLWRWGSQEGISVMARTKPPSFDFFPDDFIAGTYHLTPEAVGIYVRLLCFQWNNGSIPSDENELARIAGVDADAMRTHMRTVMLKFMPDGCGGLKNARLELERGHKLSVIEKSKAAAESRWAKEKARKDADTAKKTGCVGNADAHADAHADAMRTDMPPTSNFQLPASNRLKHSHTQAPAWLEKEWKRWCDFREAIDGRPMDLVSSEAILMDLIRRGDGKAQRDIDFSIQKRAKSICDSDNDWSKQRTNTPTSSSRRYGKETAEEARIRKEAENPPDPEIAARIKRLQEEIWNGSK